MKYVCVRAITTSGYLLEICEILKVTWDESSNRNTVYDFDSSSTSWNNIKKVYLHNVILSTCTVFSVPYMKAESELRTLL